MNVTIKEEGGQKVAVITVPLSSKPELSASGKSYILASTHGFVKPAGLLVDGKQVSVGLNVILALR